MYITKAVEALGREMGMEGLALDGSGCLTLNVGDDASLFLERKADDVAVCFARPCAGRVSHALAKGLALCRHENTPVYALRVALFRKDIIVCLCRLETHHVKADMLNGAVRHLFETMEKIV